MVGVASRAALEFDERRDGFQGIVAMGMHKGGTVIPFNDSQRAARFDETVQRGQRAFRIGEMFEHETDEDVVERRILEAQIKNIAFVKGDVGKARAIDRFARLRQGRRRDVHRRELRAGTAFREDHRLRADAAAGLQHAAALGIDGIAVEQFVERRSLVLEPHAFARIVAVNVWIGHDDFPRSRG